MSKRRGVIRKLSNLSIDEVSLVDRGANQHASIEIAKRAPSAEDYFAAIEKGLPTEEAAAAFGDRMGARVGEAAGRVGGAVQSHPFAAAGGAAAGGAVAGGLVVHHHYNVNKAADSDFDADCEACQNEYEVSKLGGGKVPRQSGSFGQPGDQAGVDEFHGSPQKASGSSFGDDGDVAGVDEINEDDDPSGLRDGVEATGSKETGFTGKGKKGDTVPAGNGKKGKVGKSDSFWHEFVSKVLGDPEFTTDELNTDNTPIEKHFPGAPPQSQPMGGGQMGPNMGNPPVAQSVGAQPMGMGQPVPPPQMQQPGMGGMPGMAPQMPQQMAGLPPEVVQYIQQLEAQVSQLQGGSDNSDEDNGDGSGNNDSSSDDNGDKKNPFGKAADMDNTVFLQELAKSLDDEDQRVAVEKALWEVQAATQRANQAEEIAKAERDLRLEREFVAKAAEFEGLPVRAEDLGPVLKRMSENLPVEDVAVVVKCLRAASTTTETNWFAEVGKRGGGDNADIVEQVNARAESIIAKSDGFTQEAAYAQVLEMDPSLYDQYRAGQRR